MLLIEFKTMKIIYPQRQTNAGCKYFLLRFYLRILAHLSYELTASKIAS